MSRKLVRSGVPHAVTFSAVTRNAVSPKYELKEGENIALEPSDGSDLTTKTIIENTNFSEGKTHIQSNMQHIDADTLLNDNIFRESAEKILNNQQSKSASFHYKDNIQSLGSSKHYKDNFQKFNDTNPIIDNRQKITDDAQLSTHHFIGSKEVIQNLKIDRKPRKPVTKVARPVRADLLNQESSTVNEDELQAKIRHIKKKLQNANQKLKNIQERNQ
jgi:hypothetical protein